MKELQKELQMQLQRLRGVVVRNEVSMEAEQREREEEPRHLTAGRWKSSEAAAQRR